MGASGDTYSSGPASPEEFSKTKPNKTQATNVRNLDPMSRGTD
jgi:hypothetical protein